MDLRKLVQEEFENQIVPTHSGQFLYHVTNTKNYNDIKSYGLLPQFGETVKQAYGDSYDLDGDGDNEELVKLDIDGLLFFSEKPMLGYSQPMQQNFKWNEVLVVIVEKNDTIFRKVDSYPKFTDHQGNEVSSVNYIHIHDLPIIIETGDWFSFEEQEPAYLLYGDLLMKFLEKNFPDLIEKHTPTSLNEGSDFEKLKKNKVTLTDEERAEVMKRKAVWHMGADGKASPAVWKSVNDKGEVTYVTNTHRAYNTAKTLKGAIGRYHKFIKGTA